MSTILTTNKTIPAVFSERVKQSASSVAYRQYDASQQQWLDYTWSMMYGLVCRWQASLSNEPLQANDSIAIMCRNSIHWVCCDLAAQGLGLIVVPLYSNDRPENIAHILNQSEVKFLLIDGEEQWRAVSAVSEHINLLKRVVSLNQTENKLPDSLLAPINSWLLPTKQPYITPKTGADKLTTIVYTSGTTGKPKGVMLSHDNILSNAQACLDRVGINQKDLFLSFLPLSHTLERTVGYYLPMICGAPVAFSRSIPQLAEDLISIRPTVLVSVPRIYERIHAKISQSIQNKPLSRFLINLASKIGWGIFEYGQGRSTWKPSFIIWPLLKNTIAKKITASLGGRLRVAVCGGAPLSNSVARLFVGLGVPMLHGYGLTETSPVICANSLSNNLPKSVGEPLNCVDIKIGANDELLVKGKSIMLGYWKNVEATNTILHDGWLHTGDKAIIVDGRVFITGRIKEIIVLSNGEKVPPADMEMAITENSLFEQVIIIGEGKPFLSAITVLNEDYFHKIARSLHLKDDAINDSRLHEQLLLRISKQLQSFPGYAQVRKVSASLEPWSVENNLITPTLKLRRNQVISHYKETIETFYNGH